MMMAGVCLLIWAVGLVKKGMVKAFGVKLNKFLELSTGNRVSAFVSGVVVTALLQSSNATALIVSSFAGQGMIRLSMALAIMLGANIGTTLVAQFLSLDLSWMMPVFIIFGVLIHYVYGQKSSLGKNVARIFLGLGFLFLGLDMIVHGADNFIHSPIISMIFERLNNDYLFAMIMAALITWLFHSSLAFVLLILSLVAGGVIPTELGLVLVVGSNIGSGIAPMVMTAKMDISIFRVTFGNFIMRLVFGIFCVVFIDDILMYLGEASLLGDRSVVNFHTAFNVAMALVFLPLVPIVAIITKKIIPEKEKPNDPSEPIYLDEKLLDNPAAALACAGREALRLGDMVLDMLKESIKAFEQNDMVLVEKIQLLDDNVDKLFSHIKHYLVDLSNDELGKEDSSRFIEVLSFSTNMEHIGDIIVKNLMELAEKKIKHQRTFSEEGFEEIKSMHRSVVNNLRTACNVLISGDVKTAKRLIKEKKSFREAELRTTTSHMKRMRLGKTDTLSTSSLHMDIIRDFKRINSHIASVAYPIMERHGEAKPLYTKIASEGKKTP